MAHFERTEPVASFDLPDTLTFRQKLSFSGEFAFTLGSRVEKAWAAVKTLAINWQCEVLPDPLIELNDLDELPPDQQRAVRQVILWAASVGLIHLQKLEEVPKS